MLTNSLKAVSLFALVNSSCATLPTYQEVQLPAFAAAYFGECRRQDGAVSFVLNRKDRGEDRIDAEWASRANGDWSLGTYSPFGQTLMQINFLQDALALKVMSKQEGSILQAVSVDEKGFLTIDGKRLGIKGEEVSCLLDMKLPQSWLRQVVSQRSETDAFALIVQDSERLLNLRLARHGVTQNWLWTLDINWNLYWGLREESMRLQLSREPRLTLTSESFPGFSGQMTLNKD